MGRTNGLAPRASALSGGCALLVLLLAPAVQAGPVDSIKAHTREAAHKVADGARRVRDSISRHAHGAASAVRRKIHEHTGP